MHNKPHNNNGLLSDNY